MRKKAEGEKQRAVLRSVLGPVSGPSFPALLDFSDLLENRAGNLPDSSHAVPQRAEYGFLRGAASKRRFQYVSVLWQQHDHCAELYGDRGHSFRTGLLRPGPVPL